jgi:hypothetical protein
MDFMYGLDNTCYAKFKVEIINVMQKGAKLDLDDLNKMYVLASRRVVLRSGKEGRRGSHLCHHRYACQEERKQ